MRMRVAMGTGIGIEIRNETRVYRVSFRNHLLSPLLTICVSLHSAIDGVIIFTCALLICSSFALFRFLTSNYFFHHHFYFHFNFHRYYQILTITFELGREFNFNSNSLSENSFSPSNVFDTF